MDVKRRRLSDEGEASGRESHGALSGGELPNRDADTSGDNVARDEVLSDEAEELPLGDEEAKKLENGEPCDDVSSGSESDDESSDRALEWEYVKTFMECEKLPLLQEFASMPTSLRVYMRHDFPPSAEELQRPARVQQPKLSDERLAYIESQGEVNVWYGRSNRWAADGKKERIPAAGHCQPFLDAGFTQADLNGRPHSSTTQTPLCLFFAKGLCSRGVNCKYFHRVPTMYESERMPLTVDIFGRERFAAHRDDMTGVGSFNSPSVTLFVGDYNRCDDLAWLEHQLKATFSIYGPLRDIKVMPNRNYSLLHFCYRAAAEFALVAMNGWKLNEKERNEIITVRWATANECERAGLINK